MRRGSVLVLVAACGAVLKPPEPNRRLNLHTSGSLFESENGYVMAALPEGDARFIRLDVRYPVGAIDDPPGKEGLAHLVEHLLFDVEITRGDRKTSIGAELGRVALSWNATTTADHTTYETVAADDTLDELLGLEADRLAKGCGALTPEIVAHEREVVLNELRERQGASGAELSRAIHEAVYPPGHPYRAVDSVETVAKLDFKDVCDFLAGPYRRGKAIIVVSGDITERELVKAANTHIGPLRKRAPATHSVPAVEPVHETTRVKGDVEEPMLLVTWPLPASSTREARFLKMVWPYIAPRLDAFAFTYHWGHSSVATTIGGSAAPVLVVEVKLASADKLGEALDAVERSVDFAIRTLGKSTDDAEWKETWQASAESLLARWESLGTRNAMLADMLESGEHDVSLIGRIDELVKAQPDAVRRLAKEQLDMHRAHYVLIEPSGKASAIGAHAYGGGAEEHPTLVDARLADQKLALPDLPKLQTIRYTLGNGLRVILWPHGSSPLVHGRLVIGAGSAHDPAGDEGVAELVGARELYPDSLVFSDRELATRVDELVTNLSLELRWPGREVTDDARSFIAGRLRKKRATERRNYAHDLMVAVYGASHPYARFEMTETSIGQIHRDLVMDWARGHMVAKNATLVITGQFDAELIKKHVAFNADQVTAGERTPPIAATEAEVDDARRVSGVTMKPSPTIELDLAFRGGRDLDEHHAARLVLEGVLAGRLSKLRAKQALTYGFSASYDPRHAGGLWLITGEADASRADEATTAVLEILAEMRRDPESYRADFVIARQKVLEGLVMTSTSSAAIADRLVEMARFELADDFYDRLARDVANLTLADFHAFMKAELAAHRQVFGAFGNKPAVDAAMRVARTVTD